MAGQVCQIARTRSPALFSGVTFGELEGLEMPSAEQERGMRVLASAIVVHTIEGWLNEFVVRSELPPIDWSSFGAEVETAAREAAELREYWDSGEEEIEETPGK